MMIGNFYFVTGDTPTLIPFPTENRVREYILHSDAAPELHREIEAKSMSEALSLFAALIKRRRSESYWSVMPWVAWAGGVRLFLPNCGGRLFVGDGQDQLDLFTNGPLSAVVGALNETITNRLVNTPSEELSVPPTVLWAQTREALEPTYTLMTRDEGDTKLEYFALPDAPEERVGPSISTTGNKVVFEVELFGQELERRVYEGGKLTLFAVPGEGGCSLSFEDHRVMGAVLNEWGNLVAWFDGPGEQSIEASSEEGRLTSLSEFAGADYKNYISFGSDTHSVSQFSFDKKGDRYRVDRSWTPSEPFSLSAESVGMVGKECIDVLNELAGASDQLRTASHFAVTSRGCLGAKFFALYTSGQWEEARPEIEARGYNALELTPRQRDIAFSLLGRCRGRNDAITTANPSNVAGVDDSVVTCAFDVTLSEPAAFRSSGAPKELLELLGHPIWDLHETIDPEGRLWIGEVPVSVRKQVRAVLDPYCESVRGYPSEEAEGCEAVLLRCTRDGFTSEFGASICERESADFRILPVEKWEVERQAIATLIAEKGPVCIPNRFDDLSKPMARVEDFLQVSYLSPELVELLGAVDKELDPSNQSAGWGSETGLRPSLVGDLVPKVDRDKAALAAELLSDLACLPTCYEEDSRASLHAGWAIPVSEMTPEIARALEDLPAGMEAMLAAHSSESLDDTAAVVVGYCLGSGRGGFGPFAGDELINRLQDANSAQLATDVQLGSPQLIVGAQGNLASGTFVYGKRQGYSEDSPFSFFEMDPASDQSANDETDDGVHGQVQATAGPYRNKMFAPVAIDTTRIAEITATEGLAKDSAFYLCFRHGN